MEEWEANFSGKLYSICLTILDLCSKGTWTTTSPHDTAKGIACEDKVGTSAFTCVPGCRIDTKSKKEHVYSHYLTVLAFLLYEQ